MWCGRACAVGAMLLACAAPGYAQGGVQIDPIGVELPPGERVAAFTLTNHGDDVQVFQVQPMRWLQVRGQDELSPATKLIASPALFRLAAGAAQVVRVGFAGPPPAISSEGAYRVLFSELPQDQAPDAGVGVHILLRLNVPLFYEHAAASAAPHLRWTLQHSPQRWTLEVQNRGDRHVRITTLRLTLKGHDLVQRKGLWYVLAGARRGWTFSRPLSAATPTPVTIHVDTDQGAITDKIVPTPG